MAKTYKAVEVSAPCSVRVVDREIFEHGPRQVRIRVEARGICHTDAATVTGIYLGFNSQNSGNSPDSVTAISFLSRVFSEIQLGTGLHHQWMGRMHCSIAATAVLVKWPDR
jgi:hypothetical protein